MTVLALEAMALKPEEGSEIASLKLKLNELLFIHDAAKVAAEDGESKMAQVEAED